MLAAKKSRFDALKKVEEEVVRQQEGNRAQIAEFDRQADLFHKRRKNCTSGTTSANADPITIPSNIKNVNVNDGEEKRGPERL